MILPSLSRAVRPAAKPTTMTLWHGQCVFRRDNNNISFEWISDHNVIVFIIVAAARCRAFPLAVGRVFGERGNGFTAISRALLTQFFGPFFTSHARTCFVQHNTTKHTHTRTHTRTSVLSFRRGMTNRRRGWTPQPRGWLGGGERPAAVGQEGIRNRRVNPLFPPSPPPPREHYWTQHLFLSCAATHTS